MSLLVNREILLAKVETTINTDAVPVASTDAVLVEEASWSMEGLRLVSRDVVKSTLNPEQQLYAGSLRKVSFKAEFKGSGAAGTAPELTALLQGCALSETIVGGVSVTYEPASTGRKTITIYYFQDGLRYILTGCVGTVGFTIETGGKIMCEFEFTGHSSAPTDVALPSGTYDSTLPIPLINIPFTVGGFAGKIQNFSFSMGNEIATPDDLSSSDGYGELTVTKRNVTGQINPEHDLVANKDWETELRSGTASVLSIGSIGSVAGNIIDFDMPAIYYTGASPSDRSNIRTLDMPFAANENTGDDEVSIALT